jgi:hypothetical protein
MSVVLTMTYHDPEGRLLKQLERALPMLKQTFAGIAVRASFQANACVLDFMKSEGIQVGQETEADSGLAKLGKARRTAVEMGLAFDFPYLMHCDCDRALHWAECYPNELAQVASQLTMRDFTVLGRTSRAFESHPRTQCDTEAIINHVYNKVSGYRWDVTAAARGLSRWAAQAILDGCPDEAISTDVSWPLFLRRQGGFTFGYLETEGLEFETADRHGAEIAAAGGYESWLARLDSDPRQWALRLELARVEVEGMLPYL